MCIVDSRFVQHRQSCQRQTGIEWQVRNKDALLFVERINFELKAQHKLQFIVSEH